VKAIADSIEEEVKENCDELPYKHEGRQSLQWVLIDYVNVVIHVMLPEKPPFLQTGRHVERCPAGYARRVETLRYRQFNRLFCRFMFFSNLFTLYFFIID